MQQNTLRVFAMGCFWQDARRKGESPSGFVDKMQYVMNMSPNRPPWAWCVLAPLRCFVGNVRN